jgi:hypothetical protein
MRVLSDIIGVKCFVIGFTSNVVQAAYLPQAHAQEALKQDSVDDDPATTSIDTCAYSSHAESHD